MKILFTSVGRRVELIQAFRNAAENMNLHLLIYGADMTTTAPALFFCERKLQVPPIGDSLYIPRLLEICEHECIDALIPTIDTDLLLLSKNKEKFAENGTKIIVCDENLVKVCRDKRLTSEFFLKCGLNTPLPVDGLHSYTSGFPCFIKPLNGSSSINAFKVDSQQDLDMYTTKICDYIIQPFIEGTEYTVDIFCDFEGNPIYITPRERITVRSGEVLMTRIAQDERIVEECYSLIKEFKPCGAITVQLIRNRKTNEDFYIEINPRFGGGVPLSIKAGADSAEMLLRLLNGEKILYQGRAALSNTVYSRFDQSICTACEDASEIKAVVFDLDDTLYSEKEYVQSGFKAVANKLFDIPNAYEKLMAVFGAGQPAIDTVLQDAMCYSDDRKQECLKTYRSHRPSIRLYEGMCDLLKNLRAKGMKLGILTDGRPEGQWNKIHALGLGELVDEIIVTDELGGMCFRKPCDIGFRMMQRKLGVPYSKMLYVGNNSIKDFIAPQALGMLTMLFVNPDGLFSESPTSTATIEPYFAWRIAFNKEELVGSLNQIAIS